MKLRESCSRIAPAAINALIAKTPADIAVDPIALVPAIVSSAHASEIRQMPIYQKREKNPETVKCIVKAVVKQPC